MATAMLEALTPQTEARTDPRLELYRRMLRLRRVEEAIATRYAEQEMRCPVHLSIGQEGVAVGACAALELEDCIVSTHRCHGHYLAKGGDLRAMLAELYGRVDGCCGGRGGSMHLFDTAAGVLLSGPIVGSSIPLGVGAALCFQQRAESHVVMVFLGDGALEEGAFHESANLASVHGLPVVFIVENNLYSVYTRLDDRQPLRSLALFGAAHAMPACEVDGSDVLAVETACREASLRARSGAGPSLIVAHTYRYREHCGPNCDDALGYRPENELKSWAERCPLERLEAELLLEDLLSHGVQRELVADIEREIAEAFAFAKASPFPAAESATRHVYAEAAVAREVTRPSIAVAAGPRLISAGDAIREATVEALRADQRVIVLGEGVADPKGVFGTTLGLVEEFGRERVLEMPLAENGFTGLAIGAALMGQRPIVVHQRVEFCLLALEQLINNAAKLRYVSGGAHAVPLVVRLIVGRGWGQGPAHSQSLESLFAYIPGLKVVMPATAADAKGLLLGAIADDDPVIFIEHRWVHYAMGDVPLGRQALPLDGPRVVRRGKDATLVANSYTVFEALQAAEVLAEYGVSVEVIDLRVLRPLRVEVIAESVARTGYLLCVDTGFTTLGIGAEIVAQVSELVFGALRAAPVRLGLPERPTPSSRSLAETYYPRSTQIADRLARLLGLAEADRLRVAEKLAGTRDALPLDIPHPSFKGPF